MAPKPKAWNIFHHFCSLLEEKFDQFKNPLFDSTHITENDIAKSLFEKFKKETVTSKDWKGFPSSKGPRNKSKGIPETTKMEKNNNDIQNLFNTFFTKFEVEIQQIIDKGIDEWKEVESDESDEELPTVKQEQDIDISKPQLPSGKQEVDIQESSNKRLLDRNEELSKKRKVEKKDAKEISKKNDDLTAEQVDGLTSELQEAIQVDISIQDKYMTKSKLALSKIKSLVDKYLPEYEKRLKDLEDHKQKIMKQLDDELEHFKTNNMTNIMELKETMDQVSEFIPEKEKEFLEIAEKKREEKKTFFQSLAKKNLQNNRKMLNKS